MRKEVKNHISFSSLSQLLQVNLKNYFDEGLTMKKILIPILTTVFLLSACATETRQPTLTPVPATDTSTPPTATAPATETTVPTVEAVLSTETLAPQNSSSVVSFSNQILPIFQTYCFECHGVQRTREGLNLTTYSNLIKGSQNGAVLVPGNANESLFVQLIADGDMPNRGAGPSVEELQLIIDWVNQGAINN